MTRIAGLTVATGLCAYAITAPFSISLSEIALLLALAGAAVLWVRRVHAPYNIPIAFALILYLTIKFVTSLTAVDPTKGLSDFYHFWIYLLLFIVPLVMWSGPRRVIILRFLAIAISVASIYAIVQHFTGADYVRDRILMLSPGRYRSVAFFSHHLTWAGFALFAALFLSGVRNTGRRDSIMFRMSALLATLGLFATSSRGALAGAVVGLMAFALTSRHGRRIAVAAVALLLLALAITPGLLGRFETTMSADLNPEFSESRAGIWWTAWEIGKSRPLVGVGPGNFTSAFDKLKINGGLVTAGHAHNQWLDEWATSGLLGVMGFTFLWAAVARELWKRRRDTSGLPASALAAWLALGAASMFECHYSDEEVLMLALFAVGMALLPEAKTADDAIRA